jgi:integrase/recombinase XerD
MKGSKGPARPLLPEEIGRLTHAASPRDRAILWCCLGAGLRISEACKLRVGDLGSDGSILIDARHAKSRKPRRVYLSEEAKPYVLAWLEQRGSHDPKAPLFPSRKGGTPIQSGSQLVEQLMARAGIYGASSHSLRRTHATGLRDQGADLQVVKTQLGHSGIQVTETYLEFYPRRHREQVESLTLLGSSV